MSLEMSVEVVRRGEGHRLALALINVTGIDALLNFVVES